MDRAANVQCQTCGEPFLAKRKWQVFCGDRCRNAFHAGEARVEKIRDRAVDMYRALSEIAEGKNDPIGVNSQLAERAIEGLKPPVEPKSLLEKAKA